MKNMLTFWTVHWAKLFAAWILRKEMANLRAALDLLNGDLLYAQRQRDAAQGKYSELRRTIGPLKAWADEQAAKADGGETQSRMLFIRDMLDHGPTGPMANSNGVHPADRWNIQSFDKFRSKR